MRRKLVALLGTVFLAAVLAYPVLAAHERAKGGGRSGSTIIAFRD
jgi:hypothetical protein